MIKEKQYHGDQNHITIRRFLMAAAVFCMAAMLMSGCGGKEKTKVVLTTGFDKDEVFRIDTISCYKPEIMVYLTNMQNQYEQVYGERIWETQLNGVTLEENVKETVLAKAAQIKTMNLLAAQRNITLSSEEKELAEQAGKEYFASLNEVEIERMGIDEAGITALYEEYALAEKVYDNIIEDINPEISDDEARTITVQHILIKTYTLDGNGQRVPYTEKAKQEAYEAAQKVSERARAGEDFNALVSEYNEDSRSTYSFGKGEMPVEYETAAFNLGTEEISDVVETEYGYHIIRCISTFNREETDANKVKIVSQRKKEVFGEEYNNFINSRIKNLNESLWEEIALIHDEEVNTTELMDVYHKYFPQSS